MKKESTLALLAIALCGCEVEPPYWQLRYEPTTNEERRLVSEQVARILSATPMSLSGQDQDWDDAIRQATQSAKETICKPTLWERKGYLDTGRWKYVGNPL